MSRERTYSWEDPKVFADAAAGLAGLDFLNLIGSGELPVVPAGATTNILPVAVGDGWAEFEMQPEEWHYNPIGSVHGGMIAGLADSALGCAVHTKLPAGVGYTSLDLNIRFTRAANLDSGLLRCRAEVVTIGRRTATAEARVLDGDGRVVAHASTTCLLLR
ncbi:aromatic compound degradation protein PaaI [Nocardioides aromaticivorans]|uniref:Aromatic compound degradation protein PaaI n=1 Tax=Nocardioides aromaticivorans TaxID=200618 RepID=A0ABX7PSH0_9ACTN|nr:PaaI family thioesterase [Nocardioides aromaticivorans]QSR28635.1 aromatic compound degradation protein PaaI [Nocardioides aromaticivorans]